MSTYDYTWSKKWKLDRQRGLTRTTDAAPIREHIAQLRAAGASLRSIADTAGVSVAMVSRITQGQPTVRRPWATKILAVTPARIFNRDNPLGFVPAIGARRRIEALQAIGHNAQTIADAAGLTVSNVHNLKHQQGDWIARYGHDAITTAYEALWDKPGTCVRNINLGRKKSWAPPMAWDDDQIDNPAATPAAANSRERRTESDLADDVEFILADQPLALAAEIAHRLGYADRTAIQNGLGRAGRTDLLDQLTRNAEVRTGRAGAPRKDTAA